MEEMDQLETFSSRTLLQETRWEQLPLVIRLALQNLIKSFWG